MLNGNRITIILALGLFSVCPAQTISGKVRDASGNPISGARVTLFSKDTTEFQEVRSGLEGEFTFPSGSPSSRVGASFPGKGYKEMDAGPGLVFILGPETEKGRWDIILG